MNTFKVILLTSLCLAFSSGCAIKRNRIADQKRQEIRSLVKVGDNIFTAHDILEKNGYPVSEPYFPTIERDEYWMDVSYGLTHTIFEQYAYGFDIPVPAIGEIKLISGFIAADKNEEIYEIK